MRWLDASPRRAAPKGHETFILRAASTSSHRLLQRRLLSAHTAQNTADFRSLQRSGVLPIRCSASVFESVFVLAPRKWGHGLCPRVAAGMARGSTVRGSRRAGLFLLPAGSRLRLRLREAGCEYGDLRFPGDGGLGRGGVPEFRAGFLRARRVALAAGDVQDVQRGAGGGVCRGGERVQRR